MNFISGTVRMLRLVRHIPIEKTPNGFRGGRSAPASWRFWPIQAVRLMVTVTA